MASSTSQGGVMMILSPAKTLDLSPFVTTTTTPTTSPSCDATKTNQIAESMKKRTKGELQKLLGISANLAETAHQYWSDYNVDSSKRETSEMKPCLFAFSGAAYQGLQAHSLHDDAVAYLQTNLRIVDPLYGLLRPLDVIQPYRLEMATKGVLENDKKTKLADWWKPSVTRALAEELKAKEQPSILVNLASDEYAAAVDPLQLPSHTIYVKVIFWEKGRVVSVHAKRARGLMAKYLAEHNVTSVAEIQEFDSEGYKFQPKESDDTTLVFDRSSNPTGSKKRSKSGNDQPRAGKATKARNS